MKKAQLYRSKKSIQEISNQISMWIASDLQFPMPEQSTRGNTVILRTRKTGALRHLSGLTFELTIELTPTGTGFMVEVDDNDIRKQLAGLGIALFIVWPMLLTSGYAMWANNAVVDQVLAKIAEIGAPGALKRTRPMTDSELDALLWEALHQEPSDAEEICPSTNDLQDFVAKTLPAPETERIYEHLEVCNRCVQNVGRLYRGLKHRKKRQEALQQHIDTFIAPQESVVPASPKRSWWSLFLTSLLTSLRVHPWRWAFGACTVVAATTAVLLVALVVPYLSNEQKKTREQQQKIVQLTEEVQKRNKELDKRKEKTKALKNIFAAVPKPSQVKKEAGPHRVVPSPKYAGGTDEGEPKKGGGEIAPEPPPTISVLNASARLLDEEVAADSDLSIVERELHTQLSQPAS